MYRFFIRRPIMAMVVAIIMVIIGLVSMMRMTVNFDVKTDPNVDQVLCR